MTHLIIEKADGAFPLRGIWIEDQNGYRMVKEIAEAHTAEDLEMLLHAVGMPEVDTVDRRDLEQEQ